MSNEPHTFVSSISTVDIVGLLLRQYADLSEVYNRIQQVTSQEIIQRIKAYKSDTQEVRAKPDDGEDIESANSVIDDIRSKVEAMETRRGEIMTPIEGVRSLVEKLFRHTGIKIGTRLSFGDAAKAVSSDALSAGEKQMLSFICYNAFYKDSVIFIDEPELSLHVDWQRHLFPILLAQQSSNQFIIATHSPFIYSKYPDKEVSIDTDRGDTQS
nr:AAA family ATPase [Aminobacter niigataensis]